MLSRVLSIGTLKLTLAPETNIDIPDSVKIFHSTYALIEDDYKDMSQKSEYGSISYINKTIHYLGSDDSEMVDTIVHELCHGICHYMDIARELPGDSEEGLVRKISVGLVTIMKDNPTLFIALQNVLNKEES